MMYDASLQFIRQQGKEKVLQLDQQRPLMELAAQQGFTAAHIDEKYGGLGLDTIANTVLSEGISREGADFNTTFAAHIGIGMLPIYFFGTEEQKEKYLPKLASAEMIASYCLTEPSSGSDALAAKTEAILTADGEHYVLNGQKMWITNAGFADLFIVFAKIDGTDFTGFLVEADTPGITLGVEEKKMGIKASSTRQVFFENVKIPKANILGKQGKGHLIAFNVLNIGRFKLGVMCLGGVTTILHRSAAYAKSRVQFGQPIAEFGAIRYKLAEQCRLIFALDSLTYRIAKSLQETEDEFLKEGASHAKAGYEAAKELALESAAIKIYGSEVLDYCADENIQIHGGMGFSEETDAPLIYRNGRINRIYEGTNEINRLLIVNRLGKLATENHSGFFELLSNTYQEFSEGSIDIPNSSNREIEQFQSIYRKAVKLVIAHCFTMQTMEQVDLEQDQQTTTFLADIFLDWFATDSCIERWRFLHENQQPNADVAEAATLLQLNIMHRTLANYGTQAVLNSMKSEKEARQWLANWSKLLYWEALAEPPLREKLAEAVVDHDGYPFRKV